MQVDPYGLNQSQAKALHSLFRFRCIRNSLVLFTVFISFYAFSQNYHCKTIRSKTKIHLDTIPVEKESIAVTPFTPYDFDVSSGILTFREHPESDSVEICYRSILPEFYQPIHGRPVQSYDQGRVSRQEKGSVAPVLREEALFAFGNVESYGAITRGITFGNRQNVFVNSSLNLQMDGQLSEDLQISAVITDQNIPYQPEGNTQQIRDFDNVYIKLYNDDFEVTAGDIVAQNPIGQSYFLKYYKNIQGLQLKYDYKLSDKWKASSQAVGSLAKGQFATAVIEPIEGVQGPYRLRGPNGERFIIILANSEKVYVDGKLLERGFDRDYVIDYNLGEITFSSNVLITRFSRIRIDYEYAEQYYVRSNLSAVQHFQTENTDIYLNFYQEKDNSQSTLGFDLSQSELDKLRSDGDQNGLARVSGIDSTEFIENAVLYTYRDTLDNDGSPARILVHSTDQSESLVRVTFSDVGLGNGDYELTKTLANGRVYQWVSPVNSESQGRYAPVQEIPLPNKKQMMIIGTRHNLGDFEQVFQELAISSYDQNLYSNLEDNDNEAVAWKGGVVSQGRSMDFLPAYKLTASFDYEYDQENFQAIDRFRSVDFDRDWSYDVFKDTINRSDQIINSSFSLRKNSTNGLDYAFSSRKRESVIDGQQHEFNLNQELGLVKLSSNNFYSRNQPGDIEATWWRTTQQLKLSIGRLHPGYRYYSEKQLSRNVTLDSIGSTLMYYDAHNIFVETVDTTSTRFRMDYIRRKDQLPVNGDLADYTDAEEFKISMDASYLNLQTIGVSFNYRKVTDLLDSGKVEDNLLGKLDFTGHLFNKHVRTSVIYSTANARELKREFVYLQVATGEGTHTWRDENDDGIKNLNEFYEAINPDEKNYIKVFTPTDEYINAFQTTMVQSLDVKMPVKWEERTGLLRELSKISFNRNVRFNYKTTNGGVSERLVPFGKDLKNTDLLFFKSLSRNSLFYNRNAPGLGVDLVRTSQKSKSLLSNGFEIRENDDWEIAARLGMDNGWTLRTKAGIGSTSSSSDFLENRNFNLNRTNNSGEIVFQPGNFFRFICGYDRRDKSTENSEQEGSALVNEYRLESTWIRATKGSLNASFSWLNIQFEGEQNTFLGYELLEALQPGNNQRWRLNWQQAIGNGLQLTIQYNGRKSTDSRPVHTGTMQVTAYF